MKFSVTCYDGNYSVVDSRDIEVPNLLGALAEVSRYLPEIQGNAHITDVEIEEIGSEDEDDLDEGEGEGEED